MINNIDSEEWNIPDWHVWIVAASVQKLPAGHNWAEVEPAGQYWVELHGWIVDGVEQKLPAEHGCSIVEPAGQYLAIIIENINRKRKDSENKQINKQINKWIKSWTNK